MKLNEEQLIATEKLIEWGNKPIHTSNDLFFTLSGFAGTGKSTITDVILKNIRTNIVVSAPTHKAKKVIQDKTNRPGETIQALLGLRPDLDLDNFNPNKPTFGVKAEEKISRFGLVAIDECSMLNKGASDLIKEKAIKFKTKILYIGDKYQLPPVKEKISQCFLQPNIVNLETIVRQDHSNPNTKLIELARNDVRDNTDTLTKYLNKIKHDVYNNTGFKVLEQKEFYTELLQFYYNSEYKYNPDFAKTICWSNTTVSAINKFIRNKINPGTEYIQKGDMLMGYTNVSLQVDGPPYYIPIVSNSEDYIVEESELIELPIEGVLYKGYKVKLRLQYNNLFILHPDSYKDFTREYIRRLEDAKNNKKWPQYYRFKNQIQLLHNLAHPNNPNSTLIGKDIDYGYAITTHKSQGSTYSNVGTIIKDINDNPKTQEKKQLKYVALSRTSTNNLLYV